MKTSKQKRLSYYSPIGIGGKAKTILLADQAGDIVRLRRKKRAMLLYGNASKTLFAFERTQCTFVLDRYEAIVQKAGDIYISSGARLSFIGRYLEQRGFGGWSYLQTIPGRLGGSIVMNASFLQQSVSDYLVEIYALDAQGNCKIIRKQDAAFAYRTSSFQTSGDWIFYARFRFPIQSTEELRREREQAIAFRTHHQPQKRSLGSTFRNLPDKSIGSVLDHLGYKGFHFDQKVRVSKRHANFLEIKKDCNYKAVLRLLSTLERVLYKQIGCSVQTEMIIEKGKPKWKKRA